MVRLCNVTDRRVYFKKCQPDARYQQKAALVMFYLWPIDIYNNDIFNIGPHVIVYSRSTFTFIQFLGSYFRLFTYLNLINFERSLDGNPTSTIKIRVYDSIKYHENNEWTLVIVFLCHHQW